MRRTIWKYTLAESAGQLRNCIPLTVPEDTTFLSVGKQRGVYVVWADVDPSSLPVTRTILVRGTGHPFDGTESQFLGSIQDLNETFVTHFFA